MTLAAGSCDQIFVKPKTIADQSTDAVVCVRACPYALVASSAAIEVEHQQALRFHEPLCQKRINWHVLDLCKALPILSSAIASDYLETRADLGKALEHEIEVLHPNAYCLHMVERGTCCSTDTASQQ